MSAVAFENYGQLRDAVADWLMRKDLEAQIPQFIRLAEAEMDKVLRTREMVKRSRTIAEGQYIPLPGDWRKARNVQRVADNRALGLMAFDEIDRYRADIKTGRRHNPNKGPEFYALVGDTMELAPSPSPEAPSEIEMIYYAQVPRLREPEDPSEEGVVDTSWLLRGYPSLYLYGALVHSAPFLKDDERLAVWQTLYQQAVVAANESDADSRFSGAPMQRRTPGFGV